MGSIAVMRRPPRRFAALSASALVLVACTSGGASPGTTAPTADAPATIESLRAEPPSRWDPSGRDWGITLMWIASPALTSFQVRRDGVLLADDLTATGYRDTRVDPATTYRYAVVGSDAKGTSTVPAVVAITTGAPAVAEARLEGSFLVRMRVVASSGLRTDPSPLAGSGSMLFRYAPTCVRGPCDVRWSVRAHPSTGVLDRTRRRYRGVAHGPFLLRSCHGGVIDGRIAMGTHVAAAGPVNRTWRATRVEGTLTESGAANGCATATITWAFAGVIQT